MAYDVPNYEVGYAMRTTHVPVGFWRSVNHSQNGFFRESFIDEMAHAAGQDPLPIPPQIVEQRSGAARRARRGGAKGGLGQAGAQGVSRGIALVEAYGSMCAQVAEASVGGKGEVRVHRVVAAVDTGHVVNPEILRAQTESAIVYGLTAALYGAITIENGRVQQGNFDDYEMLRLADMPVGRDRAGAERRVLGRRRRAGSAAIGSGIVQRDLRGDRQAHPLAAAEGPGPEAGVSVGGSAIIPR